MDIDKLKQDLTEELFALLERSSDPIQLNKIAKSLNLYSDTEEYYILKDILKEMSQNNTIHKSSKRRYSFKNQNLDDKIIGVLELSRNYGFVKFEDSSQGKGQELSQSKKLNNKKVIIKFEDFATALVGDEVEVSIYKRKIKKSYGKVLKVINRKHHKIKGKLQFLDEGFYLVPKKDTYQYLFPISEVNIGKAKHGDEVEGEFLSWDWNTNIPIIRIKKIFTKAENNKVLYDRIVDEFDLPESFGREVNLEAEAKKLPSSTKKYEHRLDLRNDIVITIDPEDAKDFDDALSIKELDNGNYLLGIHIADVSHYIEENSAIDIEARGRGNSTYLADRVVPMIPEVLSNNVCSLMPNRLRYAYSVLVEIDSNIIIHNYNVKETLIKSKKRFTYEEALEIIEGKASKYSNELLLLDSLALKLREERFKHGGIDFETSEVRFKLDKEHQPIEVKLKRPSRSTQLVEEMMLLANKIVASHFSVLSKKHKVPNPLPAIYRIHEDPEPKQLKESIEFISSFGKQFKTNDITSAYLNEILHYFNERAEKDIVNKLLVKSMTKAYYDNINRGHFGLGFDDYTHFTSPIRRYADLIVHRLLKEYSKEKPNANRINNLNILTKSIGKSISITERRSIDAERASNKLTHSLIMKNQIGEEFDGSITGLLSYGVFVMVDDLFAEGMLHIKEVDDDYYDYDENKHCFYGKRNNSVLGIGSRVRIKVIRVNEEKRFIDFSFVKSYNK